MTTTTDNAALTLVQWLSPAFPVGAFAYSHGLEYAIQSGALTSAADLDCWLCDILAHGSGRADAILLAAAYGACDTAALSEIDAIARAFAPSRERLQETDLQGAAFARTTAAIWGDDLPPLCYPVAVGRAARLHDLPLPLTAQIYLQAFASNLVSAAVRLVPLGQTEGQATLAGLTPLITATADAACVTPIQALTSNAFLADVAAMRHETLPTRIFRT